MGRSKAAFDFLMKFWHLGKVERWAANQPVLRHFVHPESSTRRNQHIMVPVNQVLTGTESLALPPMVLEALIDAACAQAVLNECMCRRAEGCAAHPSTTGCLFLGEAAAQIDPALCRRLSPEEAKTYARQAAAGGLVPMIVHSAFDADVLGIDFRRMLAVCFCCDCCCSVRRNLRSSPEIFGRTVVRFPGLRLEVNEACTACGACLDACPAGALSLADGRLQISQDCKGCGTCAAICPEGAIMMHLDEQDQALSHLFALVEARTDIRQMT